MKDVEISIFWFRRDLRIDDNVGLYYALQSKYHVLPIFMFDENILSKIENIYDKRVIYIYNEILNIKNKLEKIHSSLLIKIGKPIEIFKQLLNDFNIREVYVNEDYEPYSLQRDVEIKKLLENNNISFFSYKDHVIFAKNEIIKPDGTPYTVFTPYKKKWLIKFQSLELREYDCKSYYSKFLKTIPFTSPKLKETGFLESQIIFPSKKINIPIIINYLNTRDFPEFQTSQIGIHLRFGILSIRKVVNIAKLYSNAWLNELIWRDFFIQILYNFPHVEVLAFKEVYNNIQWENNEEKFSLWCDGKTGYPIVDAGMRELKQCGFMHNRVRMITASFLCKHLLIDWRWGEAYFAKYLLDYELASNNGNWQWAAGTGCDAAPYFRIFNPYIQMKKYDINCIYIQKWVPEYNSNNYIKQIVDHNIAREKCIKLYKSVLLI